MTDGHCLLETQCMWGYYATQNCPQLKATALTQTESKEKSEAFEISHDEFVGGFSSSALYALLTYSKILIQTIYADL